MPISFKRKNKDENFDQLLRNFMRYSRDESVSDLSVIETAFKDLQARSYNSEYYDPNIVNSLTAEKKVRATDTNKPARLQYYYSMSRYQEVSDAIDEICEGALNYDEEGKVINLSFDSIFPSKYKKQFEDEFNNFISPLNIGKNMYKYMKEFVITGELCFENIVNKDKMDTGIVGFTRIPAHAYEFAIDITTNQKVGIIVRVNSLRKTDLSIGNYSGQNAQSQFKSDFQTKYKVSLDNLDKADDILNGECLFMPWSQLMYAFLDETNVNETIVLPLLYKARRAYNQLMSMEDAIIIYTISRSPVRLSFQVGMGAIPPGKQREALQKYIKKYTNKMTYDKDSGSVTAGRNAHTMIESFWFARPQGAPETDVSQIGGDANFGDLEGLRYFQQKVYKALKIPSKRLADAGDTNWTKDTEQITYEEFAFAQLIMRLTNRIAMGLKDSFITHLKFIGLWEQIEEKVPESAWDIEFVKPVAYDLYQQRVTLQNKMEMFERATSTDIIDPVLAMKKYLGMTDEEVEANFESMKETKIRMAKIQHEATNWEEFGQKEKPEEDNGF